MRIEFPGFDPVAVEPRRTVARRPALGEALGLLAACGDLELALASRLGTFAGRGAMTVSSSPGGPVRAAWDGGVAFVGTAGVASCELLGGKGAPGFRWRDREGTEIGAAFLVGQGGLVDACARLRQLVIEDGPVAPVRRAPDRLAFMGQSLPGDALARGAVARELAFSVLRAASRAVELTLEYSGPAAAVRTRVRTAKSGLGGNDVAWISGDDREFQLHLGAIVEAVLATSSLTEGIQFLDADGDSITVSAPVQSASDWLAGILRDIA